MKTKRIVSAILLGFIVVSVGYLIAKESRNRSDTNDPLQSTTVTKNQDLQPVQAPDGEQQKSKVLAYYFHRNKRCATCQKIEAYTKEAIETGFADALADGRLVYRVINVDEPENEHFVKDYQLVGQSVVLVRLDGGKQTEWRNLDRVWELVKEYGLFVGYIQRETQAMIEGES